MKRFLFITLTFFSLTSIAQCNLNIGWTSTIVGPNITFTNASTGMPSSPQFAWLYDGQSSSMENPTFTYNAAETQVCFAIYSTDITCDDSICGPLNNPPCNLDISWTSSVAGGNITFTNTSTGMPGNPAFAWLYDGQSSSIENPTFPYDSTISQVCFAIYDIDNPSCQDSICGPIGSPPCALNLSWVSCVGSGTIGFNNTSTGMPSNASFAWLYDGQSSSMEHPVFTENPATSTVCFAVYDIDNPACQDSICGDINDTCACNLNISWVSSVSGGNITFYNTSTGEPSSVSYAWLYNGQGSSLENPTFPYDSTSTVCFAINDLTFGGCDDSICGPINIDSNATVQQLELLSFELYPNPADNELNIVVNDEQSLFVIHIFDMTGRLVTSQRMTGMKDTIDIQNLDNGGYILYLSDPDNHTNFTPRKFLKQ